jgi:pimeloyl-ACP methyl ester carboxylesterase
MRQSNAGRALAQRIGIRLLVAVALAGLWGCGVPVGVKRMDPTAVQRSLTRSILTSGQLSQPTRNVLFQHDLVSRWEDDPAGAIADLQRAVIAGGTRRNDIYALAELCFAYAEAKSDPAYHRSAAVFAWVFLFPGDGRTQLDFLDSRTRIAADLYNRALAQGFEGGSEGYFQPLEGSYPASFGTLDVYFDPTQLIWGDRRLVHFLPVAELEVEGLATRYRWSGVGAPLAASTEPLDPAKGFDDYVQPWVKVPVTALLRMEDVEHQLATGRVAGRLTLEEPVRRREVRIDGQVVSLEAETTASLAYTLAESPVWQREIGGFLQRIVPVEKGTQLASLSPYKPGRIPVVLVHGTASSPGRWAQMMNELGNDPRIGPRVQGWLFTYDTGNPIAYSAMLLRESLQKMVQTLDPEGKDPALRDMVVVGHSQGGLLAKMTVIDSGDSFWRLASSRPFDEIDLDPEQRETARKIAFLKPVPSVTRVIFIATPQRGSYVAGSWLAHQAARLIVLPTNVTRLGTDLITRNKGKLDARFSGLGTSVVGMTPGSPAIQTLSSIPIAPGVAAHSIIAVKDPDEPLEKADDGVVEYSSAHVDGVESEYVVASGHSCQDNPHTINEVRRILLEHIAQFDAAQAAARGATAPAAAAEAAGKGGGPGANGDAGSPAPAPEAAGTAPPSAGTPPQR